MRYDILCTADLSGISINLNSNSQKTPYDFLEVSLISSASQWLGFHVPDLIGSVCAEMPWNTFHCGCCASNKNFLKTSLDMIAWLLHIWALHTFNSLNHTGVVGACAKFCGDMMHGFEVYRKAYIRKFQENFGESLWNRSMSGCCSGAHVTNDFSLSIQILWKI